MKTREEPTETSLDKQELEVAVEYFREKGLEIEVCGGMKGNALIIDFVVGETIFPESLIDTAAFAFAIIPENQFERLAKSGIITDVTDETFTGLAGEIPGKIGKANIKVKGRNKDKDYQGVSIAGIRPHKGSKWKALLGAEFAFSFEFCEMGWPGDPVIGFYGCKKIDS